MDKFMISMAMLLLPAMAGLAQKEVVIETGYYKVKLPPTWAEAADYEIGEEGGFESVAFYERADHRSINGEGYDGYLFTLVLTDEDGLGGMIDGIGKVRFADGHSGDFVAFLPYDVRFSPGNEAAYNRLFNDRREIYYNVEWKKGVKFYPFDTGGGPSERDPFNFARTDAMYVGIWTAADGSGETTLTVSEDSPQVGGYAFDLKLHQTAHITGTAHIDNESLLHLDARESGSGRKFQATVRVKDEKAAITVTASDWPRVGNGNTYPIALMFGAGSGWFSHSGTTFIYEGRRYTLDAPTNAIQDITKAGKWIIVEGHVNPHNGTYHIFNTETRLFEKELAGTNFTWYGNDVTTAVYSFWNEVFDYNGELIGTVDAATIQKLSFSPDGKSIIVNYEAKDGSGKRTAFKRRL